MSATHGPANRSRSLQLPAKSMRAMLPASKRPEQVAAVCFRVSNASIEFLLVRTRRGRWIFPKGGAEPGLTRAQAAALEAFEEAGVHGRIEEASFARYRQRKKDKMQDGAAVQMLVRAFLCEVLRIVPAQEAGRNRTWFSPEEAKSCLREGRSSDNGAELARIVDRAVARIQRLGRQAPAASDALQRVQFEAAPGAAGGSFVRYRRRTPAIIQSSPEIEFAVNSYLGEVLRINRADKRLTLPGMVDTSRPSEGTSQTERRVIEINKGRTGKAPARKKNRSTSN